MKTLQNNLTLFNQYHHYNLSLEETLFFPSTFQNNRLLLDEIIHLKKKKTNLLFLYGIDFSFSFLNWLHSHQQHRLVILEDDKNSLLSFLSKLEAKEILLHDRIKIYFSEDKKILIHSIHRVFEAHFSLSSEILVLKKEGNKELKKAFNDIYIGFEQMLTYYSDFGVQSFENILCNLFSSSSFISCKSLKDRFKGLPAIICGAGPSLSDYLPLLKTINHKALIFSAGSAGNFLFDHQITPHFFAHCDPASPFDRMKEQDCFSSTVFFTLSTQKDLFSLFHGEKIFIDEESHYPIEDYLKQELDLSSLSKFSGWTIGDMLMHIALYLGCDPIIFVGMDFCYDNKKKYSGDIANDKENMVIEISRGQKKYVTQKDWLWAISALEDTAKKNNEKVSFYNLSKGIDFKYIPKITDLTILSSHIDHDLTSFCHVQLQQTSKHIINQLFLHLTIKQWQQTLLRLIKECQNNLRDIERNFNEKKQGLYKIQISEDELFCPLLLSLWTVYKEEIFKEIPTAFNISYEMMQTVNKLLFYKDILEKYYDVIEEHLLKEKDYD